MPSELLRAVENRYRYRLLIDLLDDDSQKTWLKFPDDFRISEEALDDLSIRMYHEHLPRLEASGYIRRDEATSEVAKGPNFDEIRPLLEFIRDRRDERPEAWF